MAKVTGEGSVVPMERERPKKGDDPKRKPRLKPRSKCRVWQLRVPIGMDVRTGKYRQRTKVYHGTYTEAKAALRDFITQVESDHVQGRTDWTFEAYCSHYIDVRLARGELAPSTARRQRHQLDAAVHHLGKAKLERITTATLNEMYVAMMRGDTLSGKPSSGCYVGQIHQVLRMLFKLAVREGVLVDDPCEGAMPPKKDTKPVDAIPAARLMEFLRSLDPTDQRHLAYLLAITLGLRRGEICGLSWGDIDWERRVLNVTHSFDDLGNLKDPKTKAGKRLLPLPDITYEALRRAKEAQARRFERVNARRAERGDRKLPPVVQGDDSPVFVNGHCERLHGCGLDYWWSGDRDGFGFPGYKFHGLRHSYISMLAEAGVHPKVMQELAGHGNFGTTMSVYTHVNVDEKRSAVGLLFQKA